MSGDRRTARLPQLEEVALESFSLYRLRPTLTIQLKPGVFCLAGANGLGKSSFIASLNYALTGAVAPPSGKVDQLTKYRRDATNYSSRYFTGRITEGDRGSASVGLKFRLGTFKYEIKRRFFAPHELDHFRVLDQSGNVVVGHDPAQDAEERHLAYEERLCQDSGLSTFSQFVFLQHFVFSFDEHRHLLFWDTRATEIVLYLALGLDPNTAKRVDELRKAVSAAGSGARNAQYQATLARNERQKLVVELEGVSGADIVIVDQHRALQSQREALTTVRNRVRQELNDTRLEFAEASALQLQKRQEYEDVFRRQVRRVPSAALHGVVEQSLADHTCRVCGTHHESGPEAIVAALAAHTCPLCSAELPRTPQDTQGLREQLVRLDQELAQAGSRTAQLNATIARLDKELREQQQELGSVIKQITALETSHNLAPTGEGSADEQTLRDRISQLEGAIDVALGRKEEQLELRAEALAEYEPIQASLKKAWTEAEVEFVPRFRTLAERFIGLPLQVSLDSGTGIQGVAHLALAVGGTHRRQSEQLSESQRFFLDIALRMSLTQHMTRDSGEACLYVDTPEGALDIAYEARAGEMFASFASTGDQIVMTANVNTSRLLTRMAERCGRDGMQFVRMTEWTELSEVQLEEDELFDKAFAEIEAALDRGPAATESPNRGA